MLNILANTPSKANPEEWPGVLGFGSVPPHSTATLSVEMVRGAPAKFKVVAVATC